MKLITRSIAIFFAAFAICYFFTSCKGPSKLHDDDKTGKLLNGPIRIINYDIQNQSLTLRDNTNQNAVYVVVKKTQPIQWQVTGKQGEHIEIVEIAGDPAYASSNDPNFFSAAPHGSGKNWTATVGTPDSTKPFFKYIIKWKLDSNTTTYTFDPLMQLDPK